MSIYFRHKRKSIFSQNTYNLSLFMLPAVRGTHYMRNPRILLISWYVTHFPFPLYTYLFGYVFFVLFMQYTLALDPNTLTTFITLVAAGDLTMVGTSSLCLVLGLTSGLFATKAKDRYLLRDG